MHPFSRSSALLLALSAATAGVDATVDAVMPRRGRTIVPPTQHDDQRMTAAEAKRARKNAKRLRDSQH